MHDKLLAELHSLSEMLRHVVLWIIGAIMHLPTVAKATTAGVGVVMLAGLLLQAGETVQIPTEVLMIILALATGGSVPLFVRARRNGNGGTTLSDVCRVIESEGEKTRAHIDKIVEVVRSDGAATRTSVRQVGDQVNHVGTEIAVLKERQKA